MSFNPMIATKASSLINKSRKILPALFLLVSLSFSQTAQAFWPLSYYPWGYSPLTGSSNMLWLGRSLFYPGNMLWRGGYGYSAPYYLANSLAWNAAYAASQGINSITRQNYINNYWRNNGQNTNLINGSYVYGNQYPTGSTIDQVSPANWYKYSRPNSIYQASPQLSQAPIQYSPSLANIATPGRLIDDNFMPIPVNLPNSSPQLTNICNQSNMPNPAPDFRSPQTLNFNEQNTNTAPLAHGFVEHVKLNYQSDISKALQNKDTQAYATAIGLLDKENTNSKDKFFAQIPEDRVTLIKQILNDPKEDSLTKLNTIRVLLRHK